MKTLRNPAAAFLFVFVARARRRALMLAVFLVPMGVEAQVVDTAGVRREVDSLIQVSRGLTRKRYYEEAMQVIAKAKKQTESTLGRESSVWAKIMYEEGLVFYYQGKYSEVEHFWVASRDIYERSLGKEHPDYAAGLNSLGALHWQMGNYAKSESFYLEALAIQEKVLGKEHSDYAMTLNNLGTLYKRTGNYEKAESFHLEALVIQEKVLGKESIAYARSLNNLGLLYDFMGNYEKSESFHLEALAIKEKLFGKLHTSYAASLSNLGILYKKTGNYKKAEVFLREVLAIQEKTLGKEHPDYAMNLSGLGLLYFEMSEYTKAEKCFIEALDIREKTLGKEHPDYGASLANLGLLYKQMGNYEKAEPFYLKNLSIDEKVTGKETPDYAHGLINLGVLFYDKGDYAKAEDFYLKALSIQEKVLGKEHPDYASNLTNLGILYDGIGNYAKSERYYLEALAIDEKVLGKEHSNYAAHLNNLGALYKQMGNYAKAEGFYLTALSIQEKVLGKEHPDYAATLANLGSVYGDMGDYTKSELFCLRSLSICKKVLSVEHPYYAANLINLGGLYQQMRNYSKAESFYLEAMSIQEKVLGREHPDYSKCLYNLGNLYKANNNYEQASIFFRDYSRLNQSILLKSSTYLSEDELYNYILTFSNEVSEIFSFTQTATAQAAQLISLSYSNILFHKGFLLDAACQLNRLAFADSASTEKYNALKGYSFLLATQYALPISHHDSTLTSDLEEKANTLEKELVRMVTGFSEAIRQVTWQEVQAKLRPSETAIEFVDYKFVNPEPTDSTLYAALLLLPTDTAPHFIPLFEERQLQALLPTDKAIEDLSKSDLRATYLQKLYAASSPDGRNSLYQLIWTPIEKALAKRDIKTVYYAPSGILHRLNLAALTTDKSDSTLSDKYRLVQLGSTRELVTDRTNKNRKPVSAVIYGGVYYDMDSTSIAMANRDMAATAQDTTGGLFRFAVRGEQQDQNRGDNWNYLQGSEKEARHLHELLRRQGISSTLRLGYSATEESFKQIGTKEPSPSLLHIGTHGFFFPDPKTVSSKQLAVNRDREPVFRISEHPLIRSGLLLAGAQYAWEKKRPMHGMEDGILTAHEVSQMNLSNTDLVVLSACETGLGDIKGNEGVYGLQRAFRIAGAKNVLMSLWKVSDEATALLLNRFYENWLKKSMSARPALEEAQQWMRRQEKYRNPYYWAGFVLLGA